MMRAPSQCWLSLLAPRSPKTLFDTPKVLGHVQTFSTVCAWSKRRPSAYFGKRHISPWSLGLKWGFIMFPSKTRQLIFSFQIQKYRPIRSFKCVYSPKSIDYKPSPHLFAFSFPLPRFNLQQTAAAEFYSRLLRSIMFRAVLIEQLFFPDFPRI